MIKDALKVIALKVIVKLLFTQVLGGQLGCGPVSFWFGCGRSKPSFAHDKYVTVILQPPRPTPTLHPLICKQPAVRATDRIPVLPDQTCKGDLHKRSSPVNSKDNHR